MRYGSVCSGIEAATVAWKPLGWEASFFSEIEKFPCKVLGHHYPITPNFGDMNKFKEWPDAAIDVLVGGTPCQSFSIAGLRKGLDDPRGNLMLTYLAIADKYRPKWLVWENVPGVLSSNGGKDFGALLGGLGELGYGFAYRVLDAQYFGVAQRRRRVFVVGCLGDWRRAAAVLFERHSLSGNVAPQRETREDVAGTITRGAFSGGAGGRPEGGAANHFIPVIAKTLCAHSPRNDLETEDFVAYGIQGNIVGRQDHNGGNGVGFSSEISPTLTKTDRHSVAHVFKIRGGCDGGGKGYLGQDECAYTISTGQDQHIFTKYRVRRLTELECERLQGFGDLYTNIPSASGGARYKALGNSMAIPVMRWIGERIQAVDAITNV